MPPAMHQPCTAASVGFEIECSLAKVLPKVPIIWTSATVSQTRSLGASALACASVDQSSPKPAQNALPSAPSRTTFTASIGVGRFERRVELIAQFDGDGVVLVGPAEHESPNSALVLDADGGHDISSGGAKFCSQRRRSTPLLALRSDRAQACEDVD